MTVQFRWPLGMPLVDHVGAGIWEVRSKLPTRIARTLFFVHEGEIVLLHGFIKKTRKTPPRTELWLCSAKMPTSKAAKSKNKHRGSSFENFLKKEGLLEDIQVAALKRALALRVRDLMKQNRLTKSAMAAQMRTSRAAVHRLLDPANTSVTLATLNRAARSLGRKVKIELVPA